MPIAPFREVFDLLVDNIPYMKALGARYAGRSEEGIRLRLPYAQSLIGDPETGVIAGGAVTALLDHACGMAVWDELNEYKPIATMDLRIDYMRPAQPNRDLFILAKCYKLTRSVGFVRGFAYDDTLSDPVAAAQAAFIISHPCLKNREAHA
ncbi:PaaI family thioesterase [Asticcacaulis sp.]|uniref:PaaI family thioesterase n=1 Tax=Asticcacaulis sp. TaxID=1872648 RepID=UPI0026189235|nr:PaaI family thioesterase [Asticcacaulis sp.]